MILKACFQFSSQALSLFIAMKILVILFDVKLKKAMV